MTRSLFMASLVFSLFFQFCGGGSSKTESYKGKSIQLVDVRTPDEFKSGSVAGAINIPLNSIGENLEAFDSSKTIVVFCRSGNRSGKAKKILDKNGFKNVINGGSWQSVNKTLQAE